MDTLEVAEPQQTVKMSPHLSDLSAKLNTAFSQEKPVVETPAEQPVAEAPVEVVVAPDSPAAQPVAPVAPAPLAQPVVDENEIDLFSETPVELKPNEEQALRTKYLSEFQTEHQADIALAARVKENPVLSKILELQEFDDVELTKIFSPVQDYSKLAVEDLIKEELRLSTPDITDAELNFAVKKFTKDLEVMCEGDEEIQTAKDFKKRELLAKLPKPTNTLESLNKLHETKTAQKAEQKQFWDGAWQNIQGEGAAYVGKKVNGIEITSEDIKKTLDFMQDTSKYISKTEDGKTVYNHKSAFRDALLIVKAKAFLKKQGELGAVEAIRVRTGATPVQPASNEELPKADPIYDAEISKAKIMYNGRPADLEAEIKKINQKFNK